tara:strand:+ start:432 stop:857 length:426 start_codon:yes stop_codon:yes gene_type:complete
MFSNTMHQSVPPRDIVLGVLGGIAGACLGCFLFHAFTRQGFYAMVLPGALAGIGCGSLSRHRSLILGVACAFIGAIAGVFAEWQYAPFIKDKSLGYFLMHLHQLRPLSQFLIFAGSLLAFWFGMGRNGGVWPRRQAVKRDP